MSFSSTATCSLTPSMAAAVAMRNRSLRRTFFSALSSTAVLPLGDALFDRGLNLSLLLGAVVDRLAFFAVAEVHGHRLAIEAARNAYNHGRVGVERVAMVGRRQAHLAQRHGDERDQEIDVHHEHQVDHRRDVELGRLLVRPARDQLVGCRSAQD